MNAEMCQEIVNMELTAALKKSTQKGEPEHTRTIILQTSAWQSLDYTQLYVLINSVF